jgi:hypothetical protein
VGQSAGSAEIHPAIAGVVSCGEGVSLPRCDAEVRGLADSAKDRLQESTWEKGEPCRA